MKELLFAALALLSVSTSAQDVFKQLVPNDEPAQSIVRACYGRVDKSIVYDPSYKTIEYPMGDVDPKTGVCTDAVIRVLRDVGVDLQQLVHEDIKSRIGNQDGPKTGNLYGNVRADKNIDHRRVWTLEKFFRQNSSDGNDDGTCKWVRLNHAQSSFPPGSIVFWNMGGNQGHVGIVVDGEKVFHQVCCGQVIEEALHSWKIVGAYQVSTKWWKNNND